MSTPHRLVRSLSLAAALVLAGGAVAAVHRAGAARWSAADADSLGLVVRVLDVGQGDATLVSDGAHHVLIDGGPDEARMGALLDSLHLDGATFDAVVLTHEHADHLVGLRALFESRRRITVRAFYENEDVSAAANLRHLRDSIEARVARGALAYHDTDDPCGDARPVCALRVGDAVLELMRPDPDGADPNDRSTAMKLVSRDSTFTMWIAGDAEQPEIGWFLSSARYDRAPGMHVDVLKADHHGSCNGVTSAYLDALHPAVVIASVGAVNDYGHMHEQAKALYAARGVPWYRTDQNGTVEIRSPGAHGERFTVTPSRPGVDLSGPSDRRSTQPMCNPEP